MLAHQFFTILQGKLGAIKKQTSLKHYFVSLRDKVLIETRKQAYWCPVQRIKTFFPWRSKYPIFPGEVDTDFSKNESGYFKSPPTTVFLRIFLLFHRK